MIQLCVSDILDLHVNVADFFFIHNRIPISISSPHSFTFGLDSITIKDKIRRVSVFPIPLSPPLQLLTISGCKRYNLISIP